MNTTTLHHSRLVTHQAGIAFRDLNKNGKLDSYEDPVWGWSNVKLLVQSGAYRNADLTTP